jgi:hypothetical protein
VIPPSFPGPNGVVNLIQLHEKSKVQLLQQANNESCEPFFPERGYAVGCWQLDQQQNCSNMMFLGNFRYAWIG